MTPATELGGHPGFHDLAEEHFSDLVAGEAQDVGIVVVARDVGAQLVMAQSGADAPDLVGGDAHPQARGADEDRAIDPFLGDRLGRHIGEIRVIDRRHVIGSDVHAFMPHLADDRHDELLGAEAAMVAPDGYFHMTSSLTLIFTAASMRAAQLSKRC